MHGLSIPLGKLGFYLPRQLSQALSTDNEPEPFHLGATVSTGTSTLQRIGRSVIRRGNSSTPRTRSERVTTRTGRSPQRGSDDASDPKLDLEMGERDGKIGGQGSSSSGDGSAADDIEAAQKENQPRTIRFPDEVHAQTGARGD